MDGRSKSLAISQLLYKLQPSIYSMAVLMLMTLNIKSVWKYSWRMFFTLTSSIVNSILTSVRICIILAMANNLECYLQWNPISLLIKHLMNSNLHTWFRIHKLVRWSLYSDCITLLVYDMHTVFWYFLVKVYWYHFLLILLMPSTELKLICWYQYIHQCKYRSICIQSSHYIYYPFYG